MGPENPELRTRLDALLDQRQKQGSLPALEPAELDVLESFARTKHISSGLALGVHYRNIDPRSAELWLLAVLKENELSARAMISLGLLYTAGDPNGASGEFRS